MGGVLYVDFKPRWMRERTAEDAILDETPLTGSPPDELDDLDLEAVAAGKVAAPFVLPIAGGLAWWLIRRWLDRDAKGVRQ